MLYDVPAPAARAGRSTRHSALRRAVGGFAHLLAELLDNETLAARAGLLQRLDPRAKVVGLLGLVLVAALAHRIATLTVLLGAAGVLAAASRLPWRRLAAAWAAVPLFSAAIMAPAMLNWVTPGPALVHLLSFPSGHLGPWRVPSELAVTSAGVWVAARFVLRSVVCVTLALLLSATTRPDRLFRGLRALGVPALFIMLLSLAERYLTLLLRAAEELHLARLSRTIRTGSVGEEQRWVGAGMGSLLRRTNALSADVYLAMIARGYRGEAHPLDSGSWRALDSGFLVATAVLAAGLLWMG